MIGPEAYQRRLAELEVLSAAKIADLREAASKDDLARTRQAIETLTKSLHALSQKLYAAQDQSGGEAPHPEGPKESPSGEGETVDAEFSDKEA